MLLSSNEYKAILKGPTHGFAQIVLMRFIYRFSSSKGKGKNPEDNWKRLITVSINRHIVVKTTTIYPDASKYGVPNVS